jgi:hypothetical protein
MLGSLGGAHSLAEDLKMVLTLETLEADCKSEWQFSLGRLPAVRKTPRFSRGF